MLEQLKDIAIMGGCFEKPLTLFDILKYPMNILYGQNGTGKSSIGRGIANFKKDNNINTNGYQVYLGDVTAHLGGYLDRIFVFNEDYVDENVKIEGEGLESIVMLGSDINLDNEISTLEGENKTLSLEIEKLAFEIDGDINQGIKSIDDKINDITADITAQTKADGACNERNMKLRGNQKRLQVPIADIEAAQSNPHHFSSNTHTLQKEIDTAIAQRAGIKDLRPINWNKPAVRLLFDIDYINSLLSRILKPETLDYDDMALINVIRANMEDAQTTEYRILKPNATSCPYCHQSLDSEWMEKLRKAVAKVRNRDVKNFEDMLQQASETIKVQDITFPDNPNGKFNAEIKAVEAELAALKNYLPTITGQLMDKKNHVHDDVPPVDKTRLNRLISNVDKALTDLETAVSNYRQLENSMKEAEEKNKWLAYLEHKTLFDSIADLISKRETNKGEIDKKEGIIRNNDAQIRKLQAQMVQTGTAMNNINKFMQRIFADKTRLRLEPSEQGGKYILTSRNKALSPKRISIGERNILALSYFFASIAANQSADNPYANESFVVIDDPVSSFDKGNRAGVISLLRTELISIIQSNSHSKVLVMSHDRQTIKDLQSIRTQAMRKMNLGDLNNLTIYEMFNNTKEQKLVVFQDKGSDYKLMLENIYAFLTSANPDDIRFNAMGNQIRQVMETFAKLVANDTYVALISRDHTWDHSLRLPYDSYMFPDKNDFNRRLDQMKELIHSKLSREVLNAESHSSNNADLTNFFGSYTTTEILEMARYTLFFMELYNHNHLFGFLGANSTKAIQNMMKQEMQSMQVI